MSLEVINKAREQITKESLKIGGPLANFIEEHLNKVCKTEEAAKLITAEGKSIKDLISKITSEARKNAKSNVGCISDEEVIESEDVTDMTVTELKGEIAALKARNDELEAGTGDEIENLKNRIAELEVEQSESEISAAELEAKNQEIEKLTQKLEKEKARVASAKAKANEDVQKAVDKYKAEHEKDKEKAVKEGKAELQAAYTEAERTIARLEKELSASSQDELTTFRAQVNILQEIFQSCCKSLAVIEAKDPGQGEKVRSALLQVLHTEEEQLKG